MLITCSTSKSSFFSHFSAPLHPGQVSATYFRLLTRIYTIHSKRIHQALESYLVYGTTRQAACEQSGATLSYFSLKLKELQRIHLIVVELFKKCSPGTCSPAACKPVTDIRMPAQKSGTEITSRINKQQK